ncbi:uncharacterized protein MELLADRAFT_93848 [Melampsora larici-populina 98AG31]|uniref:Uncharacterized protein n=1 Tax=Melampsora larici-populina (strain 98AG31 / pathotype 3-4-7) TaxID=747676 RepID=F4S5G7_MELLP|nr:uncharacterized protein MELLADRAFT_93848 [Melampsora larici-populina 98AG31]EGG00110.1 hypothetical protein MELLADRAFT_93848 [Melampsora larici-populina 98AG31]
MPANTRNTRSNQVSSRSTRTAASKAPKAPATRPTTKSRRQGTKTNPSNNISTLNETITNTNDDDVTRNLSNSNNGVEEQTTRNQDITDQTTNDKQQQLNQPKTFISRFPGLDLDTFHEHLDEWTLVRLREANAKQAPKGTRAPTEIRAVVKSIRLNYEKQMLMAALMGGLHEVVVWNLVGEGSKKAHFNPWIRFLAFGVEALKEPLPEKADSTGWASRNRKVADLWKALSDDEKDTTDNPTFTHIDGSTVAPQVHPLTEAEKSKYEPIFKRLVDVEKLHICHGKPEPTQSIATLQKNSLAALKKAHHDRYQITYYATAVSCGDIEGWIQTYSNNTLFAKWATDDMKIPGSLSSYVNGKKAAEVIEGSKVQQPSDERRTRLGRILNELVDAVTPKCFFPKKPDPEGELKEIGYGERPLWS